MRAAITRQNQIVVDDIETPEPGPGEVLVRSLACGICGSDLHALHHADEFVNSTRDAGGVYVWDTKKDLVFGHEFCAEVVDYGKGTERKHKIGQVVSSMPLVGGANDLACVGYSNHAPGGFGEYMRLREDLLIAVPDGLSADHAALTEPMAVGWHAVQKARMEKADIPMIVGCGPVGLAVIAALKLIDSRPIIASDFSPARRELALKMGADIVVDPGEASPYDEWSKVSKWTQEFGPAPFLPPWVPGPVRRPTVIFECVGIPGLINKIMDDAPANTRIIVVGVCMQDDVFKPLTGLVKEINVQFSLGYDGDEFRKTLHNIADGKYPVDDLITGQVGLDGVAQAFADLGSPGAHAKILVKPGL